jgi:predicted transcriptional regulator
VSKKDDNSTRIDENQFKQLLTILKSLDGKLSVLISQKKYEGEEITIPKSEEEVLRYCTGSNSIDDIMKKTNQNRNTVTMRIKRLKKKGLIISKKTGEKTTYQRV